MAACRENALRAALYIKVLPVSWVLFYTHISDKYTPFYTKVIAANARDATHVLDGLLYHESDLRIEEH